MMKKPTASIVLDRVGDPGRNKDESYGRLVEREAALIPFF